MLIDMDINNNDKKYKYKYPDLDRSIPIKAHVRFANNEIDLKERYWKYVDELGKILNNYQRMGQELIKIDEDNDTI
jgi:hypothetical protein